jgi:hypothetical protein
VGKGANIYGMPSLGKELTLFTISLILTRIPENCGLLSSCTLEEVDFQTALLYPCGKVFEIIIKNSFFFLLSSPFLLLLLSLSSAPSSSSSSSS